MHLLTQQFRRIDRAYKVLTDPLMRQAYDLYGERVRRKTKIKGQPMDGGADGYMC